VTTSSFESAANVFDVWREDILMGSPPDVWPVGAGSLANIEFGPGRITLVGGAPASGKTALGTQLATDAARITPSLRVLVCNVEMSPEALLDRQLARISGIGLTTILNRQFGPEHVERIDEAMITLEPVVERLAFLRQPFNLENVAASADAFGANLLVLDYIQRIPPPGRHADNRISLNATMDYLRRFADAGVAVLVIAAVGRTKDKHGRSSYCSDGLNLASYRESSELEFGADDAFMLVPTNKIGSGHTVAMTLKHL
jgi:replicative DNA helicase